MQYANDGPTPPPLIPSILYLDRLQSVADCVTTALLLEAWLMPAERPAPSYQDPGDSHATQ
jgi:hypothetical protein